MLKRRITDRGEGGCNITNLIDCLFILILFFILAGQSASTALARLVLYKPAGSQAQKWNEKNPNRIIVNVPSMAGPTEQRGKDIASAGQAKGYMVLGRTFNVGDVDALAEEIRKRAEPYLARKLDFFVEIRADKRVNYAEIEPVLIAAAKANINKLNLSAELPN